MVHATGSSLERVEQYDRSRSKWTTNELSWLSLNKRGTETALVQNTRRSNWSARSVTEEDRPAILKLRR
jgi:hypothetical protein